MRRRDSASRPPAKTTTKSQDIYQEAGQNLIHRLTVVFGLDAGESRTLKRDAEIGREPSAGGWPLADPEVSRRHARIHVLPHPQPGLTLGYEVADLGSSNGTFVNGERLEGEYILCDGDILRIGSTLLAYEMLDAEVPAQVVARCPAAMSLRQLQTEQLADVAAPTDKTALIVGPTGSGKERLASRIHEKSGREGDFVAVNCSAFPRELLPSELFGHVKGAFSGAETARVGLFRAADRGTLFLDEIAEFPLEQQAVLLRVLQEKQVRPVGSDAEYPVDVRVIAATHRAMDTMIDEGTFRRDLWARIAGFHIDLYGLNQRRVEILPTFASMFGKSSRPKLDVGAAEQLLVHDWPDNFRGLQRLEGRFSILQKEEIRATDLPEEFRSSFPAPTRPYGLPSKKELLQALQEAEGKVKLAAESLGISRQKLYRLLQKYGVDLDHLRGP